MNATFLTEKHMLDITTLTGLDVTFRPWDINFGSHLEGFAEAIDLCTSINATICEDGTNFGLADAARVLGSAGQLWSKRVEGMVRATHRTLDCLNDIQKGIKIKVKNVSENGTGGEEKEKIRKRSGHPLACTVPDHAKGKGNFLAGREQRRSQSNGCTLKDLPRMAEEAYLLQTQPSSLPLLDCERICSYVDDRNNKGLDWAEFRVNTVKLTKDGFFPLSRNGNPFHEMDIQDDFADLSVDHGHDVSVGNFEDQPQQAADEPIPAVENAVPNPVLPEIEPEAGVRSLRSAAVTPLQVDEPFRKTLLIDGLKSERDLKTHIVVPDQLPVDEPFRRRNKRVMKAQEVRDVTGEVGFFMNFWDIFNEDHRPQINLKAVMNRYQWRLKTVEVKAPARKGRGRRKKEQEKTVKFVSVTGEVAKGGDIAPPAQNLETVNLNVESVVAEGSEDEMAVADAENYVELDEPVGDDDALKLDMETDFFAQMVKDPRRRLSIIAALNPVEIELGDDADGNTSFVLPVDLHEWEGKLTEFLQQHEATTSSFDLEEYGLNLVAQCSAKFGRLADVLPARDSSSGEVCRTFLSVLDLVNKKLVEFGGDKRGSGQGGISRDFEHLEMRLHAKSMEVPLQKNLSRN